MKVNSVDSKTNFGWRYPTHQDVTSLIAKEYPKLKKYTGILTDFVKKPDFDETGFRGNNHFYYPPMLFKPRESFLDFTGKNNAMARYETHIYFFDKLVNKDNDKAFEHAGRALHFLQDVTQPQHVQRGNIFQKWKDFDVHKDFEAFEYRWHDIFINHAKKVNLDVEKQNYLDLFDEAVFLSESSEPAAKTNDDIWFDLAQDGISNMIAVTREFCKNISDALH